MAVKYLLRRKSSKIFTVAPDTSVAAAARLLLEHSIGGLPVVTPQGRIVGFFSERDVARGVDRHPDGLLGIPVEQVMQTPPPICSADDTLHRAMTRMTRDRLRHLVVLEGEEILGVISVGDLVKHRLEQLETEAGVLRDYVVGQRALR